MKITCEQMCCKKHAIIGVIESVLMATKITIVGGGLAGSEAAWQVAKRGLPVDLYEMRPQRLTGAHRTADLAELVCSNSLGSRLPDRASGVLLRELREMGSILINCAESVSVPAGGALAVDRELFAKRVTERIEEIPGIKVIRKEVEEIPEGWTIIASGPLTSPALSKSLERLTGINHLYFFDALSPIVEFNSIDMRTAYHASRYGRGSREEGDYINCPFTREEYDAFVEELVKAERIPLRVFEDDIEKGVKAGMGRYFEGCLPIEVIAGRGRDALAYGPMRPVGLTDPRTGRRPHAVLQLRQDNLIASLYNLVGFQTNLNYEEQQRVFRMIPGLESAHFVRYGQMHRNTFINAPLHLRSSLQHREREKLFFAGQITGVEGYLGNIATGLLAGINIALVSQGVAPVILPRTTMLGALCHYISHADPEDFQPMKANFGLMPVMDDDVRRNRRERARAYADRSEQELAPFLAKMHI